MGGAFISVADDATASYWNPAGIGRLEKFQTSLMFQKLASSPWPDIEGITPTYQFFNFVAPLNKIGISSKGSVALSIISMGIKNIPHTYLDSSGTIIRNSFNDIESAYYLSLGYPLFFNDLLVGGSIKYISQKFIGITGGSAWGWDVEAGMLLLLNKRLSVGLVVRKGPKLKWANGHIDSGDLKSKIGVSYKYEIRNNLNILSACDFIQEKDMPLKSSAGIELSLAPNIEGKTGRFNSASLRTGIDRLTVENRYANIKELNENISWNIGGGLNVGLLNFDMQIDYAFSYHRLGSKHRFSLILELL